MNKGGGDGYGYGYGYGYGDDFEADHKRNGIPILEKII